MGSAIPLVKREMRNLCILRMVHGFIQVSLVCAISRVFFDPELISRFFQGLTFLLVQSYLITTRPDDLNDVHHVSIVLSLFSVCWALASFNKNIRPSNIDKLVLTWIGVIFQLLWRLGTVSSRVIALIVYASAFESWVFLVMALHWFCMFIWLVFQKVIMSLIVNGMISQVFSLQYHKDLPPETTPEGRKKRAASSILWSFILSYVYNFSYINVDVQAQSTSRLRVAVYYAVTFVENILLVTLWTTSVRASLDFTPDQRRDIVLSVVLAFIAGLFFMGIYYRLFHTSKISYGGEDVEDEGVASQPRKSKKLSSHSNGETKIGMAEYTNHQAVFNCALNPALKKKKKIPSVLPPPPGVNPNNPAGGKMATPFWKEPLPDHNNRERSTTPLADIRQKLQNKRENQLKQLQAIESEIRAGQIQRPRPPPPELTSYVYMGPPPPVPGGGVKRQPYLYINDPHNDSSGDQGK